MQQKFLNGERVYRSYINNENNTFITKIFRVDSWEYLDGMQWEVIDEYKLTTFTYKKYLGCFKKTKKNTIRDRAILLENNPDNALIKLKIYIWLRYSYLLLVDTYLESGIKVVLSNLKNEIENIYLNYPELVLYMSDKAHTDINIWWYE